MKHRPLTYEQIFKRYRKFFQINKEIAIFYSRCIKLMYQIVQDVIKIKNKKFMNSKEPISGAKALFELYEIKMLHNFMAHYTLLKNGLVIASYSPLRSIYETIIKCYFNITHPELGELNFKFETLEDNLQLSKLEFNKIKSDAKKSDFFRTSFLEKKMYSDEVYKHTRKFYKNICNHVHPSIQSMSPCFEFQPNSVKDTYYFGIALTSLNFILLFELYSGIIKKRYKMKLLDLSGEYHKYIPQGFFMLIPSKNQDKLNIKNYNELIDILK